MGSPSEIVPDLCQLCMDVPDFDTQPNHFLFEKREGFASGVSVTKTTMPEPDSAE